ncbi:Inosine/uridine-preferring nucleoside hydrolase domain-containing protein [Myxozyma melibiosi]|uniref:Inosine/uridine-preferring nucleoside hydrolase domain-containing protein n=1 Tax=Myxozyma melibiosi TaxID=54550 RepID=A0ABR1F0A1_9ASCO
MSSSARKLIIDCDPGVDDTLALLYALNSPNCDIALISLCFGNVPVSTSIRNVLSIFQVLESERAYRTQYNLPLLGYHTRTQSLSPDHWPTIALGSDQPVSSRRTTGAEFFHGVDGLGGVHEKAPQFSPPETFLLPFLDAESLSADKQITREELIASAKGYKPSSTPSWREILRVLREEPPNTVTLVALAPLANIARAAIEDPITFSRVKEIACMGGNIDHPGNMSPFAEYNVYADVDSAAIVFATTSRTPASTLPPSASALGSAFANPAYVPTKLYLFPLDLTSKHRLRKRWFVDHCEFWLNRETDNKSHQLQHPGDAPLAMWMSVWLGGAFGNMDDIVDFEKQHYTPTEVDIEDGVVGSYIEMHDPLTVFFAACTDAERAALFEISHDVDIRVETVGQFTWGMCAVDRRNMPKRDANDPAPRDVGEWLALEKGNRLQLAVKGPGSKAFSKQLLDTVLSAL